MSGLSAQARVRPAPGAVQVGMCGGEQSWSSSLWRIPQSWSFAALKGSSPCQLCAGLLNTWALRVMESFVCVDKPVGELGVRMCVCVWPYVGTACDKLTVETYELALLPFVPPEHLPVAYQCSLGWVQGLMPSITVGLVGMGT